MSRKHTFIKGTFVLTLTGLISRCLGFLYRIFISRIFGAEGLALYQLIFPVYAICFALSTAGIETSIARVVSAKVALNRQEEAKSFLLSSMLFSLFLSVLCMFAVQRYAENISTLFLNDSRTYDLLIILSYAFPFASIHSCITGYYLGLKQTIEPSISQLLEQCFRVGSIYLIYHLCISNGLECGISLTVIGLLIGEMVAALISIFYITRKNTQLFSSSLNLQVMRRNLSELLPLSIPLTSNRIVINILNSIESISIPLQLQVYGLSSSEALVIYGVLIGMALPCILFPTALTSSVASMLLPTVAEIQAKNNKKEIKLVITKTVQYCTILGLFCLISFFLFSNVIGTLLFHDDNVAYYLKALAWLCPFLYLNTNLLTIINGLGKPTITFAINVSSLLIRIFSIYFIVPQIGISGYLFGLLISQVFITLCCGFIFSKHDII